LQIDIGVAGIPDSGSIVKVTTPSGAAKGFAAPYCRILMARFMNSVQIGSAAFGPSILRSW